MVSMGNEMEKATETKMYVNAELRDKVEARIKKFNNKSKKFGNSNFWAEIVDTVTLPYDAENSPKVLGMVYDPVTGQTTVDYIVVVAHGVIPKMKGYKLLGAIKNTDEGIRLYGFNGVDNVSSLVSHDNHNFTCDHCKTKRDRNINFVFQHEDGSIVQVGSSCVSDFFGSDDPMMSLYMHDFIYDIENMDDDSEREYDDDDHYAKSIVNTAAFVGLAMKFVDRYGYQSSKYGNPTWVMVWAQWKQMLREHSKLDSTIYQNGKDAVAWARDKFAKVDTSFGFNVTGILRHSEVYPSPFNLGILTFVASAYLDHKNSIPHKNNDSEFVGTVGDLVKDVTMKVVGRKTVSTPRSPYSDTVQLVNLQDEDGNDLVWWSNSPNLPFAGDKIRANIKIKKHDKFNGINKTTVSIRKWTKVS